MPTPIFIDPKIDLNSSENIQIIVQFKTKPAIIQAKLTPNLTIEKARQLVEESHSQFQQDVVNSLDKNQIDYVILNRYKEAYNGVAMKMKGKDIKHLLQSNEIGAIYKSQLFSIPPQPNNPR